MELGWTSNAPKLKKCEQVAVIIEDKIKALRSFYNGDFSKYVAKYY